MNTVCNLLLHSSAGWMHCILLSLCYLLCAGQADQYKHATKGANVSAAIRLSFLEAALGAERDFTASARSQCTSCSGSGISADVQPENCTSCSGSGQILRFKQTPAGTLTLRCNGRHTALNSLNGLLRHINICCCRAGQTAWDMSSMWWKGCAVTILVLELWRRWQSTHIPQAPCQNPSRYAALDDPIEPAHNSQQRVLATCHVCRRW